ncbi:hypothetical protein SD71_04960 [Cohnella kolymensis]|uniref:Peptidoglycan binding domain-containing protein n=1 Tax=Cohnella kolymensis TaxID=1590652 RepID=A0ABR5A8M3_9BACL|nr:hypothetical protein SD71_04960 [Cohnella kolymensis]
MPLCMFHMNTPGTLSIYDGGRPVMSVNRAEYTLPALPVVNADKFDQLLNKIDRQISVDPVNAKIDDNGKILPAQAGYTLNREKFTEQFYTFLLGRGSYSIELPRTAIYPKVDTELLAYIREKNIGQYVTYFNARNGSRAHNIALAAKAINNQVVFPNELFSFNRTVGMRTKLRGYKRAPVIVQGELAEDIGGGICQVSSTLYNAVDRAGLQIVQRYSHSRNVQYVPPRRDATVSWNGPDFVFQNRYNQPILIRAHAGAGRISVSIYSSEMLEHKPRRVRSMSQRMPLEISVETRRTSHPADK